MEIKRATRTGIKPLIGIYAESGCGKTYSMLAMARGIAGPDGRIIVGDSESGRASLYADIPIFGGYDVIDIDSPFPPSKYIDVIDAIESAGASVGCLDSISAEWDGVGGVLDMAADIEQKSGKPGLHIWKQPKYEHSKFVQRLMRSKIPWIVCLRAKYKSRQTKENGKTVIVKDDHTSPIQADDFIFECTAHLEILPDHSINLTKHSHPGLKACFPEKGPIEVRHGEMIAKWCAAGGGVQSAKAPSNDAAVKEIKTKLWKLTDSIHKGRSEALEQHLWDENLLDPDKRLADLTESELRAVYAMTEKRMGAK